MAGPDGEWWDVELWRDFLAGAEPRRPSVDSLVDQVEMLLSIIDEVAATAAAPGSEATLERLREYGRLRAKVMLPDVDPDDVIASRRASALGTPPPVPSNAASRGR